MYFVYSSYCDGIHRIDIVTKVYSYEVNLSYFNPVDAAMAAFSIKKKWEEEFNLSNVNIYVMTEDNFLILKTKLQYKLLNWADEEYKRLPKCKECRKILDRNCNSKEFLDSNVFCSEDCRNKDLASQQERLKDNEETEFDL